MEIKAYETTKIEELLRIREVTEAYKPKKRSIRDLL